MSKQIPDDIIALTNSFEETGNDKLRNQLIVLINELINKDFTGLVQLLYRVDINESKLKQALENLPEADTAPVIADFIIRRQWEKMQSKKNFRRTNQADSTEEKW